MLQPYYITRRKLCQQTLKQILLLTNDKSAYIYNVAKLQQHELAHTFTNPNKNWKLFCYGLLLIHVAYVNKRNMETSGLNQLTNVLFKVIILNEILILPPMFV